MCDVACWSGHRGACCCFVAVIELGRAVKGVLSLLSLISLNEGAGSVL